MRQLKYLSETMKRLSGSINKPKKIAKYITSIGNAKRKWKQMTEKVDWDKKVNEKFGIELDTHWAVYKMCGNEKEFVRVVGKALKMTKDYLNGNKKTIREKTRNHKYVLIIGSERTGGSYVKHHLIKSIDGLNNEDDVIVQESIPKFKYISNLSDRNNFRQCVYQIMQWIVWINENYSNEEVIVKKSAGFPYSMELVKDILGKNDIYTLITTRHPAAIYRSSIEGPDVIPIHSSSYLFGSEPPPWWIEESERFRALFFWEKLFSNLVEGLPKQYKQNLRIVEYGCQEEAILETLDMFDAGDRSSARKRLADDSFKKTDRKYSGFWYTDIANVVIQRTKKKWERSGVKLPVYEDRIE